MTDRPQITDILLAALFRTDSICGSPSTTVHTVGCLIQDGQWAQRPGRQSDQPLEKGTMASLSEESLLC
uniref:Uncharacterized protein n=1 Tax=Magallana gigas TaxID=29159 RepID=K1Q836_MAGGI